MNIELFFTVFQNVHRMLKDRGYNNLIAGYHIDSLDEFKQRLSGTGSSTCFDRSILNFIVQKETDSHLLMVFFSNENSIGSKHLKEIQAHMKLGNINRCVLIYPKSITPPAMRDLESLEKTKHKIIETFSDDDLLLNIVSHRLMPVFTPLSQDEKTEFLQRTGIKYDQLPRIHTNDPVARYYGMVRGDIIKICRKSRTAGLYVSFRVCI